ncbi:hypothetical protein [Caulobacter sp. S45]|uniref:hypothetical protein n=1 Tax=Caulobacter sp. S45 TaxID=1641861 RepID=UPI001576A0BD|nr:hypothetical protein [Caulobacter sp. S45]
MYLNLAYRWGPNGAKDEFLIAATAQNLRKLAKLVAPPAAIPATRGESRPSQARAGCFSSSENLTSSTE